MSQTNSKTTEKNNGILAGANEKWSALKKRITNWWSRNKLELELIYKTKTGTNWEEKIEKLSEDKELQFKPNDGSHPWIMICNAILKDYKLDATETIKDHLRGQPNINQPGMVIMINHQGGTYDFETHYPDPRIKHITFVDMEFKETYRLRKSLNDFIKDLTKAAEESKCVEETNGNAIEVQEKQNMDRQAHIVKNERIEGTTSAEAQKDTEMPLEDNKSEESKCVEETNGNAIEVQGNRNMDRQAHIVKNERIEGTTSAEAQKDTEIPLKDNKSEESKCVEETNGNAIEVQGNRNMDRQAHIVKNERIEGTTSAEAQKDTEIPLKDNKSANKKLPNDSISWWLVLNCKEYPAKCSTSVMKTGTRFPREKESKCVEETNGNAIEVQGNRNMDRQAHIVKNERIEGTTSAEAQKDTEIPLKDNKSEESKCVEETNGNAIEVQGNRNMDRQAHIVKNERIEGTTSAEAQKDTEIPLKDNKSEESKCVEETNGNAIEVQGNQNMDRQAHIVKNERIEDTTSAEAQKDTEIPLKDNKSEESKCVEETNGNAIEVQGNRNMDRQAHIVKNERIEGTTSAEAQKDTEIPLKDNKSEESKCVEETNGNAIEVQGNQNMDRQAHIVKNERIEDTTSAEAQKDTEIPLKDNKSEESMCVEETNGNAIEVQGNQNMDRQAHIVKNERIEGTTSAEAQKDTEIPLKDNKSGDNANNKTLEGKGVYSKRVYIKCIDDFPKRAISYFIERYITRIEPIWMTGEDPIDLENGSLCIAVCFNLSRLQDEIAAVLQVTPQDCKNMLVVIQNCREGMSPKPMLRSNPSDKVIDFTNILYDDGKCYVCDVNAEARKKMQAFIDNN